MPLRPEPPRLLRGPAGPFRASGAVRPRRGPRPDRVRLASESAAVSGAIARLLGPLREAPDAPAPEVVEDLELCLAEAINNCIEHAYDGVVGRPILLGLRRRPGAIRLTVADRGRPLPRDLAQAIAAGLPPAAGPALPDPDDPDSLAEGGWGWLLIGQTADRVAHVRRLGWTVLVLEKFLGPRPC